MNKCIKVYIKICENNKSTIYIKMNNEIAQESVIQNQTKCISTFYKNTIHVVLSQYTLNTINMYSVPQLLEMRILINCTKSIFW